MTCRRKVAIVLSVLFSLPVLSYGAEGPAVAIGQTVTQGASIDDTGVPSGTTVLEGSVVSSGANLVLIQLGTGQMLELSKHSSAVFQVTEAGVWVRIQTGTISFLGSGGETITAPSGSLLIFPARQAGRAVTPFAPGIVAVLTRNAGKGDLELRVNDTARIDSRGEIVIRSKDGETEEVHRIASTTESTIRIRAGLQNAYRAQSLLIQIRNAETLSGAGRRGAQLGSGGLLGIGAGAGLATGVTVESGNDDEGAKELNTVQPNLDRHPRRF
jgi:hypothetical protein